MDSTVTDRRLHQENQGPLNAHQLTGSNQASEADSAEAGAEVPRKTRKIKMAKLE